MAKQHQDRGKGGAPTVDDLTVAFNHGRFSPLYLLYGEEDFLVEELTDLLLDRALAVHERDFNFDLIYGADSSASAVISLCRAFPMMAERRVVIVREVDKLAERELLADYAAQPSPETILVLTARALDLRKKPFNNLKAGGVAAEFKPLYDREVPSWIAARVKKRKGEITPEAARLLQAYVGNGLRELTSELDKLFVYLGDRSSRIDVDEVNEVVGVSKQFNVFELTKAVAEDRLADGLYILGQMLGAGEPPLLIVTMLTRHLTILWRLGDLMRARIAEPEMARAVGVSPFFVKEYLGHVARFPPARLHTAFEALLEADRSLKHGGQPRWTMERLLFTLGRPAAAARLGQVA